MNKIPPKILESHIDILGKTGSGKTYTAKGIAESILDRGGRICVIDPTSVWYGLRSDPTGRKAAYPIVVFGGDHADLPIGREHGAAIAEIVGTTDMSAIMDTRLMTVGERTQFFTDFAETLLRKNKGPLHLIIDECHLFMPQGRVADPQSGKMLHAANNLVSLGRGAGLRVVMISQRPAKVHKDSLTQAEVLIAMRLIAPQDRNAVEDWIGEWAEPAKGRELLQSLPSLKTGTGWVWAPEQGILERMEFPKISTYDSSRAPDGSAKNIVLAAVDLPTIQQRLQTVAKDIVANDPRELKRKIQSLTAELEKERRAKPVTAKADPDALRREFERGAESAKAELKRDLKQYGKSITHRFRELPLKLASVTEDFIHSMLPELPAAEQMIHYAKNSLPVAEPPITPRPQLPPKPIPSSGVSGEYIERVGGILRKILTVLAQFPKGMGSDRLAMLAGTTVSGHFTNSLGSLRTAGYITAARVTPIQITTEGLAALGDYDPMPVGAALRDYWVNRVGGLGAKILGQLILRYPNTWNSEDLAAACGTTVSGHFSNTIGSLRTMGLMTPARTPIKASDYLFEE